MSGCEFTAFRLCGVLRDLVRLSSVGLVDCSSLPEKPINDLVHFMCRGGGSPVPGSLRESNERDTLLSPCGVMGGKPALYVRSAV